MEIKILSTRKRAGRNTTETVSIHASGHLYWNKIIAGDYGINETKQFVQIEATVDGVTYPALLEHPDGNKVSRQLNGYIFCARTIQRQMQLAKNTPVYLEPFENEHGKGFLIKTQAA